MKPTTIALLTEGGVTVAGLAGLIFYRLNKKFKKDRDQVKGFWPGLFMFLDTNIVEIICGMVLVPDWSLILEVLK